MNQNEREAEYQQQLQEIKAGWAAYTPQEIEALKQRAEQFRLEA